MKVKRAEHVAGVLIFHIKTHVSNDKTFQSVPIVLCVAHLEQNSNTVQLLFIHQVHSFDTVNPKHHILKASQIILTSLITSQLLWGFNGRDTFLTALEGSIALFTSGT